MVFLFVAFLIIAVIIAYCLLTCQYDEDMPGSKQELDEDYYE